MSADRLATASSPRPEEARVSRVSARAPRHGRPANAGKPAGSPAPPRRLGAAQEPAAAALEAEPWPRRAAASAEAERALAPVAVGVEPEPGPAAADARQRAVAAGAAAVEGGADEQQAKHHPPAGRRSGRPSLARFGAGTRSRCTCARPG